MTHRLTVAAVLIATSLVGWGSAFAGMEGDRPADETPRAVVPAPTPVYRAPDGTPLVRQDRNGRVVWVPAAAAASPSPLQVGRRVPDQFRDPHFVVGDWRQRNLDAPTRGTHWVQTGTNYVLVSNRNGVITRVMFPE